MAVDAYLFLTPTNGPGAPGTYKDINGTAITAPAIEVSSFTFGVSDPMTIGSTGPSAGKPTLSSFNVTKQVDAITTQIFSAVTTGKRLTSALVIVRKAVTGGSSAATFLQYLLTTVGVTDQQFSYGSGEAPSEAVSFDFVKIAVSYRSQNPDGTFAPPQTVTYDVATSSGS